MITPSYPWTHLPKPLSVQEFYVLLAFTAGESYPYELKARVMNDSLGSVKLADGTLTL